jgi:uncharacterized RDD family membrane protein YckC
MPTPGGVRATTTSDGVPLAPLVARLSARTIDWVIKTGLSVAIGLDYVRELVRLTEEWQARQPASGPIDVYQLANDTQFGAASSGLLIISLLVSVVYTVPLVATQGATPGKWLLRVRVRPVEVEGPPGWGRSITRWVTREGMRTIPIVGLVYLAMDTAWPLWDPTRQALHDKIPRTVVVRSR